MLQLINDLPPHVAGLHAYADVTESEYESTLTVVLDALVKRAGKISFVLVLETDIANFISGAWCGNIKIGMKHFFKWKRVAIVTDQRLVLDYSHLFKYVIPGRYRRFPLERLDKAMKWVCGK